MLPNRTRGVILTPISNQEYPRLENRISLMQRLDIRVDKNPEYEPISVEA